jgi:hypothetical protein
MAKAKVLKITKEFEEEDLYEKIQKLNERNCDVNIRKNEEFEIMNYINELAVMNIEECASFMIEK